MTTQADPPDPYLQLLLNILFRYMKDPSTDFYLPKLIAGQTNPTYEPYVVDGEWSLSGSAALKDGGNLICFASMPSKIDPAAYQGVASVPPDLTLASPNRIAFDGAIPFQVTGISNVLPGQPIVTSGETATASATFSTVTTWPHANGITVQGNYRIHQPCCASKDGSSCAAGGPPGWTEDGVGTFSVRFKTSSANITGTAYTEGQYLLIRVDAIEFTGSTDISNTEVAITINTISDPNIRELWEGYANTAIRDPGTIKAILSNLHDVLNKQSTRDDIAKVINDNLKKIVNQHATAIVAERAALLAQPPEHS